MSKVTGCQLHISLVWKQLKAAKTKKLDLTAVWLDVANDYGFTSHQLTFFVLQGYGIDPIQVDLLKSCYRGY